MSRLDEALRRHGSAVEPATAPASDGTAAAAWDVMAPAPGDPGPVIITAGGDARPPVGVVGFAKEWRNRLAAGQDSDPQLVEQFRRLAATLHHAHQTNNLRSLIVTSAAPGDGKTLTAVNLALVLAESYGYRVLLIDADLRRPSIPSIVDLGGGSGLSEVLRAPSEQKLALVPITSRLALLPAGQPIANSIEALTSPRMRQILNEANSRFDWVIVDSPPVGPTTDARLLAQMVGGTLFVVHAERTQCPDVQKGIEALGREQILGVVLNGAARVSGVSYEYYGVAPEPGLTR